jgi:LPXTG-motif cell wall-anchored protein
LLLQPGTWAAAALLMGGATYLGWRRRRDEAQKEAA